MIDTAAHVLFYALAAAASPLVLAATYVVIGSKRPRTNGIAYLIGFLLGTVIGCILGLVLGQAAVDRLDSHETMVAVLVLLLGLALVAVGLRAQREPAQPEVQGSRAAAILAGLGNVGPAATFSMAGLLGFGGPKRLVLTFLAMEAITASSLRYVEDLTLVVGYVAVATLVVTVPVGIVVIAGERAAVVLARGQSWLTEHAVALRVWLALGIGAALIVDALLRLLA